MTTKLKEDIGMVHILQRDGTTILMPPAQARRLAVRLLILADDAERESLPQLDDEQMGA